MGRVTNPLEGLGYSWKDYCIFKKYLRLPYVYLKVIFKNYREFSEVPVKLPHLIALTNTHIWNTQMKNTAGMSDKLFKARGVPPSYIQNDGTPIGPAATMGLYNSILNDAGKFSRSGAVVLMHSPFETGALQACSQVVKQAINESRMVQFGALLDKLKEWDANSPEIKQAKEVQLLGLYMVGKEYCTDFTKSVLQSLVTERRVEGKTTIISSHLTPSEFIERYRFDPHAVPMKFEDMGLMTTVNALTDYMRGTE